MATFAGWTMASCDVSDSRKVRAPPTQLPRTSHTPPTRIRAFFSLFFGAASVPHLSRTLRAVSGFPEQAAHKKTPKNQGLSPCDSGVS